jgi:hypothetical protein
MTEFNRILTDSQIVQAIELRWAGKPWFSVKRACKASVQSVQQNIWKYLYRIEMLDLETVHSIWNRPTTYRSPGWSWLEKNTGIYVTKYGAQLGPRYESHHSTKPFGDYLRDPKQWHIEAKQEK